MKDVDIKVSDKNSFKKTFGVDPRIRVEVIPVEDEILVSVYHVTERPALFYADRKREILMESEVVPPPNFIEQLLGITWEEKVIRRAKVLADLAVATLEDRMEAEQTVNKVREMIREEIEHGSH